MSDMGIRTVCGIAVSAALISGWFVDTAAAAPDYPSKPIRWIVPFPPGGSNDVLARYVGMQLSDRLGQQIIIDNRAGANGIIGTEIAANAPNDGYTMLMVSTSYVMNAAVRPLPYDVVKSFDPVATIGSSPNCIVASPASGFASVADLIAKAKANPGTINYASTGVGGFNHFGGELFKKMAQAEFVHVPYKGGGPAMTDVMAGQVPIMFSSLTQVLPNVRTGRLKLLGIGADKRSPVVPDIPTISEAGVPGYEVSVWWGVVVPAGTKPVALTTLRTAIATILGQPETQKRLAADAAEPMNMKPEEMRAMIRADVRKWAEVARVAGIRLPAVAAAR
jgi:tripartite-type tricarboxylate transporter receptor subunit TctC